jgi:hypothetical protein
MVASQGPNMGKIVEFDRDQHAASGSLAVKAATALA